MKAVLSLLILLALPFQGLFAQSFKGKIIDATTKEALSFANVVLLQAVDSAFVTGTVSGDDGTFSLVPPAGKSILRISLIGYETYTGPLHSQDPQVIALAPRQEMLSEVVVTGHAKMFKLENGGISADIQNTPLKNIGNLSDVLGQMPFVTKDNNAFTVLGKGSPIFYINNRLVRDNNDLLRISSNEIKKVTVVTNPGAEYDASVNAVIKIETFRPAGEGFSADLWTYNRYNSEWYTQDRISLNYRTKNLDIFANMEYANMSFPKDRIWTTEIQTEEGQRTIVSKRNDDDMWKFYTPKVGFNYIVNVDHSFGAQYEYFNNYDRSYDYDINTTALFNSRKESPIHTQTLGNRTDDSHYINGYYNGKIAEWLNVKVDFDYKTSSSEGYSDANNKSGTSNTETLRTVDEVNYDLYAGKLSLQTPLWGGNLIYGAEISHTYNEQTSKVDENTGIPGITASTNDVTQDLFAGFLSYNHTFGAFSGDVGIRYENVNSDYYENGQLVQEQSKKHQRLFPTFRLSYNINKELHMELAYRNSVSRPSYNSLRSLIGYMGPYTYASGNPLLQPTYTNTLTYMLGWKHFTLMGIYSKSEDLIIEMGKVYMDNSVMLTQENIDKTKFLAVSLNYSNTFGIWRPNWEIGILKNFITNKLSDISYNKPTIMANLRNSFRIRGWNFGLDISANSKGHTQSLTYNEDFSWGTNIYVNKSFLKERLIIGIQGNDIFNTRKDNISYHFSDINMYYGNEMYRRSLMLSITYRFNTTSKRYKGNSSTDELKRL